MLVGRFRAHPGGYWIAEAKPAGANGVHSRQLGMPEVRGRPLHPGSSRLLRLLRGGVLLRHRRLGWRRARRDARGIVGPPPLAGEAGRKHMRALLLRRRRKLLLLLRLLLVWVSLRLRGEDGAGG